MDDKAWERYVKNRKERKLDAMANFHKQAKAYERFLRKPYSTTIGKVEVLEDDKECGSIESSEV